MKRRTAGHRALEAWVKSHPEYRPHSELAKVVGLTRAAVAQWRSNHAVPDSVSRIILQDLAGIPERSWLVKDQIQRLERYFSTRLHAA